MGLWMRDNIANVVRVEREERGLNQTRLAELARCSRQTVARIEQGHDAGLDIIVRVLNALDLTLELKIVARVIAEDETYPAESTAYGRGWGEDVSHFEYLAAHDLPLRG